MDNNKKTYKAKTPYRLAAGAGFQRYVDYDETLERNILGVCIMEPEAFGSVYSQLSENCFYDPGHRQVYQAIHTIWQQGHPLDLLTITRQLYTAGVATIGDANTAYYLTTLTADVVSGAHLPQWCALLRQLSARRMLITLTRNGLHNDDVADTIANIQQQLQEAMHVRTPDDWIDTATAAHLLAQHMEDVRHKKVQGISTTFAAIDDANGGMRPGQLVVIGARPSAGKSALMGAIALEAAKQGHSVGIISLEMPAPELMGRMLSRETRIAHSVIDRNRIDDTDGQMLVQDAMGKLAALPLWFADTAQMTIHDIRARAEKLKRNHNLSLLIVDYLQLIEETAGGNRSREQNISAISRGLKLLAMNLEIPVIALSQLNRESENRANKRPTISDLRESGAIEQDADIIMLLHRDWRCGIYTDAQGNSTEYQADLFVAKWRNGTTLDLKLHFHPATMTFSERNPSP